MKKVAGKLKLELAQFAELEAFAQRFYPLSPLLLFFPSLQRRAY